MTAALDTPLRALHQAVRNMALAIPMSTRTVGDDWERLHAAHDALLAALDAVTRAVAVQPTNSEAQTMTTFEDAVARLRDTAAKLATVAAQGEGMTLAQIRTSARLSADAIHRAADHIHAQHRALAEKVEGRRANDNARRDKAIKNLLTVQHIGPFDVSDAIELLQQPAPGGAEGVRESERRVRPEVEGSDESGSVTPGPVPPRAGAGDATEQDAAEVEKIVHTLHAQNSILRKVAFVRSLAQRCVTAERERDEVHKDCDALRESGVTVMREEAKWKARAEQMERERDEARGQLTEAGRLLAEGVSQLEKADAMLTKSIGNTERSIEQSTSLLRTVSEQNTKIAELGRHAEQVERENADLRQSEQRLLVALQQAEAALAQEKERWRELRRRTLRAYHLDGSIGVYDTLDEKSGAMVVLHARHYGNDLERTTREAIDQAMAKVEGEQR